MKGRVVRPEEEHMMKRWISVIAFALLAAALVVAGGQTEKEEESGTAAVGAADVGMKESPLLTEMADRGELPPLENRIPSNPQVVQVLDSLGQYGGRMRSLAPDPTGGYPELGWFNTHTVAELDPDFEIVPCVAASFDLSDDYRVLTISLREGMKWSDGEPFTTRDVEFWYEDVLLNEELTPTLPQEYAPGGEAFELEVIDEVTFRMHYSEPFPRVLDFISTMTTWAPFHHLKQFHIRYNDEANDIAKSEGYDQWWESYEYHAATGAAQQDMDTPTLNTYVLEEIDSAGNQYYVRNPYFFKVDEEGRQLPYIDYIDRLLVENLEVLNAKTISGETTHASWFLTLPNYPLFKKNEGSGGFTAGLYPDTRASEFGLVFNYTHKDPVLREIFNDLRWRKAMSHAINREEMNEIQFLGQGTPRQPIADPGATFFEEGIDQYYTEHNPELANQLLDEMGLEWDSAGQWRMRPDGKPIQLTLEYWAGKSVMAQSAELIKGYWSTVGVDLSIKPAEKGFYQQRLQANQTDMGVWAIGGASETYSRQHAPIRLRPPWHWPNTTPLGGVEWWNWYNTNGREGVEPPEIVQHLYEIVDQWLSQPRGTDRYIELGKEIFRINAENAWLIGTVGLVPRVAVIDNRLRNTPQPGDILSVEYGMWSPYLPEQWYFAGE